jgi:hypothetical protein
MESDGDRIKAIFDQALEKKLPAERERLLAEACQGQPELREEIESLLRAHEHAGDFPDQTMPIPAPDVVMESTGKCRRLQSRPPLSARAVCNAQSSPAAA